MSTNLIWEVVSEGTEDKLVLAVDYSINGRKEAGFSDLAVKLPGSFTVWETLAPPVGEEEGMSGPQYVSRWVDAVRETGKPVHAVLGYCASSAFASAIADGLAEFQDPPRVVLFDPTPATAWTILLFGFYRAVETMNSALEAQEVMDIQKQGWEVATQHSEDLDSFRDEIVSLYRSVGDTAFARVGLDGDLGEQLVAWFRGYVTYLIAASAFVDRFDLSDTVVIASSSLEDPPGQVAKELRFDLDHADLLSSEDVAQSLAAELAD